MIDAGHAVVLADRSAPPARAKAPIDLRPYAPNLPSGWHAHTTDHAELDAWARAAQTREIVLNGGLALVGTCAIIDLYTADAVTEWEALCKANDAPPIPLAVRSLGKQDEHGNWIHRDGGHVYLRVPESMRDRLSAFPGAVTLTGDVDVKLSGGWVAAPPAFAPRGHASGRVNRRATFPSG